MQTHLKSQSLSNGMSICNNKAPKRSEYFSPLSSWAGLYIPAAGPSYFNGSKFKGVTFGKSAVAILLLPVEQKQEQKCHISNIQK